MRFFAFFIVVLLFPTVGLSIESPKANQDILIATVSAWDGHCKDLTEVFDIYKINKDLLLNSKHAYVQATIDSFMDGCHSTLTGRPGIHYGCNCETDLRTLKNFVHGPDYQNLSMAMRDIVGAVAEKKQKDIELAEAEKIKREKQAKYLQTMEKERLLSIATSHGLNGYIKGIGYLLNQLRNGKISEEKAQEFMLVSERQDIVFKVVNTVENYAIYLSRPRGSYQIAVLKKNDGYYAVNSSIQEGSYFKFLGTKAFTTALGAQIDIPVLKPISAP